MVAGIVLAIQACAATPDLKKNTTARADGSAPPASRPRSSELSELNTKPLLKGHHLVVGIVEAIQGNLVEVDTGELQPRYLPLKVAEEKGLKPIQVGDKLTIVLNEQNLAIDYHHFGELGARELVRAELTTPLPVGHRHAVVLTEDGTEHMLEVRPWARSRIAGLPVGEPAIFVLDETKKITDAFWGDEQALARAEREHAGTRWYGSPAKHSHSRIPVTFVKAQGNGTITVRNHDGEERVYQARPLAQEKLASVDQGEDIVLLVEEADNTVLDIAKPKTIEG